MQKTVFITLFTAGMMIFGTVSAQRLNGEVFTFRAGKYEWSDTVHKKLLTKEMAKTGAKPVPLAIRYKMLKKVEDGKWYRLEITNESKDTKIKFKVSSNHSQELYSIKLNPGQTKLIEKFALNRNTLETTLPGEEDEYNDLFLDENVQNR